MLQGRKYELMFKLLNISEICYMIERLNSNKLLTNQVAEKSLEQFTGHMLKAIKVTECWR